MEKAVAIYSRKSKFTGKGESIENQVGLCRQHIQTRFPGGGELVYEDEGYSGGNIDRPEFKRLMADARAGRLSAVVCYRLDRISRNIGDFAALIEELDALGVAFVSVREQFDTSSPLGRAMMYIASVFSQLERETIAERIRDNMLELAKTGRWLGGNTPIGYASEAVEKTAADGRIRKSFMLTVIPDEAAVVRTVFDKFLEDGSLTRVEDYLDRSRIRTRRGKLFTRFAIRGVLENPVYMIADEYAYEYWTASGADVRFDADAVFGGAGIMAYNRTLQKKGRSNRIRNTSEWIIAVGRHEGLVSAADWIRAQELLGRSKARRGVKRTPALLSGLLYCRCGARMRPKQGRADGYSYLCETKEKSRLSGCDVKNPSGCILDKLVCDEITRLEYDGPAFTAELARYARGMGDTEPDRLRKLHTENEAQINSLMSALARSPETAHERLTAQIGGLHEKSAVLMEQITELTRADCDIKETLSSFAGAFGGLGEEQKRAVLRAIIDKVVWDGEEAHVYYAGGNSD